MKIHRVGTDLFMRTDRQTDRLIDVTKLIVVFRNFAKAPDNWWRNTMEQCHSWKVASHQLVKTSPPILEFRRLLPPTQEPGTVPYPIPRLINPAKYPTLLLRTHRYPRVFSSIQVFLPVLLGSFCFSKLLCDFKANDVTQLLIH